MSVAPRQLRRCALLLFPGESLNAATLDRIVREGFSDVGVMIVGHRDGQTFTGQGFSLEQGRGLADMAHERGLGLVCFSGYMKYQEDLSGRIQREDDGRARIPLRVPGDAEILAIRVAIE